MANDLAQRLQAILMGGIDTPPPYDPRGPIPGSDASFFPDIGYGGSNYQAPVPVAPTPAEAQKTREQELLDILFGGEFTPQEAPKAPSNIDTILGGVADAISTRARAMNPYVTPTNMLDELRQRRAERARIMDENKRGQAEFEQERRRSMAEYELGRIQAEQKAKSDLEAEERKFNRDKQLKAISTEKPSKLEEDIARIKYLKDLGYVIPPEMEAQFLLGGDIKKDKPADGEGQFAGFKSLRELTAAVQKEADAIYRSNLSKDIIQDPSDPFRSREVQRPGVTREEAVRQAMMLFPGAEEYIKVPSAPTDAGITEQDILSEIERRR